MKLSEIYKKTKDSIEKIDVKKIRNDSRSKIQEHLKSSGLDQNIKSAQNKYKELEAIAIKKSNEFYKENEDKLEKPISTISNALNKVSEHKEPLKWAGAIISGIVAPVPTLIASSILFMISSDDEATENIPDVVRTENEWISLLINSKENTTAGIVKKGSFKGKSFDEIGVKNMKILASKLPDTKEAIETKDLIMEWINWSEKNSNNKN